MKVAVIYASTTGNTQSMAKAIAEGARAIGTEVMLEKAGSADTVQVLACDVILLGSPAMGAEVLEEDEMEPFFTSIENNLSSKKIALFGSYDWGDGEWMRNWEDRVRSAGATLVSDESLIINLEPDDEGIKKCREFGSKACSQ